MNKYLNPEALAEALETGATADEIAAAMAKALNEALAAKKAKDERVNALAEAENAVLDAMENYMKLLLASEAVDVDVDELDWKDLRENAKQGLKDLRDLAHTLALLSKLNEPAAPATKEKETVKNPIEAFLAANGL